MLIVQGLSSSHFIPAYCYVIYDLLCNIELRVVKYNENSFLQNQCNNVMSKRKC